MELIDFLSRFRRGDISILCENGVDRQKVIQLLLDNGIPHGSSGWSMKMLLDPEADKKEGHYWMCVKMGFLGGIEFTSRSRDNSILFDRIAHLVCPTSLDLDDLI